MRRRRSPRRAWPCPQSIEAALREMAAEGAGSIRRHAVSRKPAGRQSSIAPRLIKSNCARVLTILKSRLYK